MTRATWRRASSTGMPIRSARMSRSLASDALGVVIVASKRLPRRDHAPFRASIRGSHCPEEPGPNKEIVQTRRSAMRRYFRRTDRPKYVRVLDPHVGSVDQVRDLTHRLVGRDTHPAGQRDQVLGLGIA